MKKNDQTNFSNPQPALEMLTSAVPVQLQMDLESCQSVRVEQVWQLLSIPQQHSARQALVMLCQQLVTDQLKTGVAIETPT